MSNGKTSGYVIGGLQILAGIALIYFSKGTLTPYGVSLIASGVATIGATALSPGPPRPRNLRDSKHYGVDTFENPRGPATPVNILYGIHRVRPGTVMESVSSLAERHTPGVDAQRKQSVKWLGAVCEGEASMLLETLEVNDRRVLSDPYADVSLGKGDGSKRAFALPHRWAFLGSDEEPAVEVKVAGVVRGYSKKAATTEFTVPAPPPVQYDPVTGTALPTPKYTVDLKRTNRSERILEDSVRVFISGTGHPEAEQLRSAGTYRWSAQKVARWKVRLRFATRPPTGFRVKATYDYLDAGGMEVVVDPKGQGKVLFGSAPASGAAVTASYRTTAFQGLRIYTRPGTLDQAPIPGFTDVEQAKNPNQSLLGQNQPVTYSTAGREVDDLRLGFLAPRGMIQFKDDGGSGPAAAKVRIEYRPLASSAWTMLRSPSGTEFKLAHENPSPVRWQVGLRDTWQELADGGDADAQDRLEELVRGPYEVRVTRLDKPSTDALTYDELHLNLVVEVLREGYTYPGTALLAFSGMPPEFLSGASIRVSVVARRGALFDPRTNTASGRRDLGSSQNAALALLDLATSSQGLAKERFGGGHFFTGADLFLGTDAVTGSPPSDVPAAERNGLIALADYCDEWVHRPGDDVSRPAGPTNGERRCRLNLVLDTPTSLMEAISDMAFLGYCMASLQGARWRFPLDVDGTPVFEFVDDADPPRQNCSKVVLQVDPRRSVPSHLVGQFWDAETDWERDDLAYPVAAAAAGAPRVVQEVSLLGCTRKTEATRMLRHLAEQAAAHPHPVTWEAHPGVQFVEAGDVVTLRTRIPWSTGNTATELRVRVLAGVVARDDRGRVTVRYAGRVMRSAAYTLSARKPVSSAAPPTKSLPPPVGTPVGTSAGGGKAVYGLSARVV